MAHASIAPQRFRYTGPVRAPAPRLQPLEPGRLPARSIASRGRRILEMWRINRGRGEGGRARGGSCASPGEAHSIGSRTADVLVAHVAADLATAIVRAAERAQESVARALLPEHAAVH